AFRISTELRADMISYSLTMTPVQSRRQRNAFLVVASVEQIHLDARKMPARDSFDRVWVHILDHASTRGAHPAVRQADACRRCSHQCGSRTRRPASSVRLSLLLRILPASISAVAAAETDELNDDDRRRGLILRVRCRQLGNLAVRAGGIVGGA